MVCRQRRPSDGDNRINAVSRRVWGLIQARMGSSRLPGKVMMPLAGRPLVLHILDRLNRVNGLSGVVLATTCDARNDPMVDLLGRYGTPVVRCTAEDDIAARLAAALDATGADAFVKVNADCPLFDPAVASELLRRFLESGADSASNKHPATYPLGYSVEIVGARAIRWCDGNLSSPTDRELCVKWILDHPEQFPTVSIEAAEDRSDLNLTVDTPADYDVMCRIFDALYLPNMAFGLGEVLRYLSKPPT